MKTHIGPIYLILGMLAVSALTIGASGPKPTTKSASTSVHRMPASVAEAFQATSPGMAVPNRVLALAEVRARRKAG